MTQRDWVLNAALVFILAGFGSIGYAFWRGRRAASPPGRDVDAWWSQLMQVEAVVVVSVVTIFVGALAFGGSVTVFLSLMAAAYFGTLAYTWKVMQKKPSAGAEHGGRNRVFTAVVLASLLFMLILIPVLVRS
jgi:hypothetical protein